MRKGRNDWLQHYGVTMDDQIAGVCNKRKGRNDWRSMMAKLYTNVRVAAERWLRYSEVL
jgi:hypothetical protein